MVPRRWTNTVRNKLHVTNLPDDVDDAELRRLFSRFGTVRASTLVAASGAGRASKTGLVEMASDSEGDAAVTALNAHSYRDRVLAVAWSTTRDQTDVAGTSTFSPMNIPVDVPELDAG
jgi:RNA recognition motif-containing protein